MDHRSRNPDRADALHSLSQAIARGTLQVLRKPLRGCAPASHRTHTGQQRREGADNGDPIDLTARCAHCGNPMEMRRSYQKYCTQRCERASSTALETAHRIASNAGRKCEACGKPIDPARRVDARFCCITCRDHKRHRRRKVESLPVDSVMRKVCPHCGVTFSANRSSQVHCCRDCKNAAKRARQEMPCGWCGSNFNRSSHRAKYCCMSCAGKAIAHARRDAADRLRSAEVSINLRQGFAGGSPCEYIGARPFSASSLERKSR